MRRPSGAQSDQRRGKQQAAALPDSVAVIVQQAQAMLRQALFAAHDLPQVGDRHKPPVFGDLRAWIKRILPQFRFP